MRKSKICLSTTLGAHSLRQEAGAPVEADCFERTKTTTCSERQKVIKVFPDNPAQSHVSRLYHDGRVFSNCARTLQKTEMHAITTRISKSPAIHRRAPIVDATFERLVQNKPDDSEPLIEAVVRKQSRYFTVGVSESPK